MHAASGQSVEIGRQRRDQRLALTGLHLCDVPEVQAGPAHDLHVVVALAQGAASRFPHRGECLGKQIVESLTIGEPGAEFVGERAQFGVRQDGEVVLDGIDLVDEPVQTLDDLALAGTEKLVEQDGHAGQLLRKAWLCGAAAPSRRGGRHIPRSSMVRGMAGDEYGRRF